MKNARAAFCPGDIMQDAAINFSVSGRYKKHMLIESAQEYEDFDNPEPSKSEPAVDLLADMKASPGKLGDALKMSGDALKMSGDAIKNISGDALKSISAPVKKLGRSIGVASEGKKDEVAPSASAPDASASAPDHAAESSERCAAEDLATPGEGSRSEAKAEEAGWPSDWPEHEVGSQSVAGTEWPAPTFAGPPAESNIKPGAQPQFLRDLANADL